MKLHWVWNGWRDMCWDFNQPNGPGNGWLLDLGPLTLVLVRVSNSNSSS